MPSPTPTGWSRLKRVLEIRDAQPLDQGLVRINARLGLHGGAHGAGPDSPTEPHHAVAEVRVEHSSSRPRSIFYTPDLDGQADSGEVVRALMSCNGPLKPAQERSVVVIGRTRAAILGLLISPNPDHAGEETWLEIGSGEWDEQGRQCWVRLDRVLEIPEEQIRRQGTLFPARRFERIANRMRSLYHWG